MNCTQRGGAFARAQHSVLYWHWRNMAEALDLAKWVPIEEAVLRMGLSKRTLERMISKKEIESRERREAGRKPRRVIAPEDVEKHTVRLTPVVLGANMQDWREQQAAVAVPPAPAAAPVAFLSTEQAARLMGIPERILLREIHRGFPAFSWYEKGEDGKRYRVYSVRVRDLKELLRPAASGAYVS